MRKIIFALFILLTVLGGVCAQDIQIAPLTPEFLRYLELKQIYGQSISNYNLNLSVDGGIGKYILERNTSSYKSLEIPTPLKVKTVIPSKNKATYPASYDLRAYNRVTPIRNQNPWGTCWAFSAMASTESNYLTKYSGASNSVDYSELNLVNKHGFLYGLDEGGNYTMSMAYFSRLNGPVNETDDPYESPWTSPSVQPATSAHVENVSILYERESGSTVAIDSATMNLIKEKIINNGAVTVSYYDQADYYSDTNNPKTFYCSKALGTNHAVSIVGWDDNFAKASFKTTPDGDGAFLVRNSWGSFWGDSGYFWISYYDKTISRIASFEMDKDVTNYDYVYMNDFGGMLSAASARYGRSAFTISQNATLKALRTYCYVGGSNYKATVRLNDTVVAELTGSFEEPGYYTIPLNEEIALLDGDKLVIDIDYNLGNKDLGTYIVPIELNVNGFYDKGTFVSGRSFASTDGVSWTDLVSNKWNTCIRALVNTIVNVEAVSIDETLILTKGETKTIEPTFTPVNVSDKSVTWESDNVNVATVDANGLVNAVGKGKAHITVIANGGDKKPTSTCTVTVLDPATALSLEPKVLNLTYGVSGEDTGKISAIVYPTDTLQEVVYTSDNSGVTVDSDGVVTAVKPRSGETIITVTTIAKNDKYRPIIETCVVNVRVPVTGFEIYPSALEVNLNRTATLETRITPENATVKDVIWESSDENIATVDENGIITGVALGDCIISATSKDSGITRECALTVVSKPESITLAPKSQIIDLYDTYALTYEILPTTVTDKRVTFTSSDTKIASVDSVGVVTALKVGSVVITVSTVEGNLKATCNITVRDIRVYSVSLDKKSLSLIVGDTDTLVASILPVDARIKDVTWSSSNSNVATVDENGFVTAVGAGTAKITVTTTDGKKTASCTVTVTRIPTTNINISDFTDNMLIGDTYKFAATVYPSNATNTSVAWSSSNSKIATVDSEGNVTALKAGKVNIIAKTVDGKIDSQAVTVKAYVPVTKVTISPSSIIIKVGGTRTVTTSIKPINATDQAASYSSFNENICKVSSDGVVTGVGIGTTLIKVITKNGLSANCMVTVRK